MVAALRIKGGIVEMLDLLLNVYVQFIILLIAPFSFVFTLIKAVTLAVEKSHTLSMLYSPPLACALLSSHCSLLRSFPHFNRSPFYDRLVTLYFGSSQ